MLICALLYHGCADWAILHPTDYAIAVPGATRVEAPVSTGGTVEAWVERTPACQGRDPEAFVLRFCGNGERAEDALPVEVAEWASEPVEVWAENHPGYGGSTATATLANLAPAAVAMFDTLKRRAGGRPIFVTAHSLGSVDALYLAAHRDVAGVIVRDPPPLRELICGNFAWLWPLSPRVARQVPLNLGSLANARHAAAPAVFIMADHDTVVPPKYQEMVFAAYAGPKRQIIQKNAGHVTPVIGATAAQLDSDLDWLWSLAVARPTPALSTPQ